MNSTKQNLENTTRPARNRAHLAVWEVLHDLNAPDEVFDMSLADAVRTMITAKPAPVAQAPATGDIAELIDRVLAAQQDLNLEANLRGSQTLCSVSSLLDEVETALRTVAAPQKEQTSASASEAPREPEFSTGDSLLDALLTNTHYLAVDGGMDNGLLWHSSLEAYLAHVNPTPSRETVGAVWPALLKAAEEMSYASSTIAGTSELSRLCEAIDAVKSAAIAKLRPSGPEEIGTTALQNPPALPPLTEEMRAVLRNENDIYDSEDALYSALGAAAHVPPG